MDNFYRRLYGFIKINISLILCYIVVSIFLILMIFNYCQTNKLEKISRGFLSRNFQEFHVNSNLEISDLENIIKEELPNGGAILKKEYLTGDINADINKIYLKKDFKIPTLLDGRFLSQEESFSDKKLAVIGKDLLNNIKSENNKKWILINDIYYEVIGICGETYESKLDSTIFIPMKVKRDDNLDGVIIIDEVNSIDNLVQSIERKSQEKVRFNKVEEEKIIEVSVDPQTGKTIEKTITKSDLNNNFLSIYIYLITFVSAFLCVSSISVYWYEKNKKEMIVCNILGFYKKEILFRILKKYFTVVIFGSFIGTLVSIVILNIL